MFAHLFLAMRTMPDPHHFVRFRRYLTLLPGVWGLFRILHKLESYRDFFLAH
jgi:hypothetical protein